MYLKRAKTPVSSTLKRSKTPVSGTVVLKQSKTSVSGTVDSKCGVVSTTRNQCASLCKSARVRVRTCARACEHVRACACTRAQRGVHVSTRSNATKQPALAAQILASMQEVIGLSD